MACNLKSTGLILMLGINYCGRLGGKQCTPHTVVPPICNTFAGLFEPR